MKKIFTFVLGLGLSAGAFAQSFELNYASAVPPVIYATLVEEAVVDYVFIKNISGSDKVVRAERTVNTVNTNGTYTQESYFCWDNCYGSGTSLSSNVGVTIPSGGSFNAFSMHFNANTVPGCANVTMRFFDKVNTADFVEQSFQFCANETGTSILDEIKNGNALESPYPNPVSDILNVKFQLPRSVKDAQVQLIDMTGKTIRTHTPGGTYGMMVWDMQELPEGLYYMIMTGEGAVIGSQKIMVKH
ncbi:MAG: T9SS type A sorting domain-containing protein [Bacteroidia bacterium]|nr:T9SS type A sorting domain-containing protein [Bacteroidia bacterium]